MRRGLADVLTDASTEVLAGVVATYAASDAATGDVTGEATEAGVGRFAGAAADVAIGFADSMDSLCAFDVLGAFGEICARCFLFGLLACLAASCATTNLCAAVRSSAVRAGAGSGVRGGLVMTHSLGLPYNLHPWVGD